MKECPLASELTHGWQALFSRALWKALCGFWACSEAITAIMFVAIHVNNTSTN